MLFVRATKSIAASTNSDVDGLASTYKIITKRSGLCTCLVVIALFNVLDYAPN